MRLGVILSLAAAVSVSVTACGSDDDEGGGGANVSNCAELCEFQPTATTAQTNCAASEAEQRGFPVLSTLSCLGITSVAECNQCYADVNMDASTCAAIGARCLP